jgi:hypothetical protein
MTNVTVGLPRSYFYQRLANDLMCELVMNKPPLTTPRKELVMKVNIQDALDRLRVCPVCGHELESNPDHPAIRYCECGEFTVTEVWLDGDVTFEFKMFAVNVETIENEKEIAK